MPTQKPRPLLHLQYDKAAEAYLRSLPPEHFMEAIPQAKQREISVASLSLVKTQRSDMHYFNELLVQYRYGRRQVLRQVVPDNMVVVHPEEIEAEGHYSLELQPVGPFWVLEYVSKSSERKDYEDNFQKYERELKVPYYLVFYPDAQELTLYHHNKRKYVVVKPNEHGRYPIMELDLEVAILDGWVRFWYKGELLPLPAELQRELDEARRQLRQARREIRQAQEEARQAREEAERERQEKERLLARLRELGVEPPA
jgi:hypothetical protein